MRFNLMAVKGDLNGWSAIQQGWRGSRKNVVTLVGFTIFAAIVWGIIQALQVGLLGGYFNKPDVTSGSVVL